MTDLPSRSPVSAEHLEPDRAGQVRLKLTCPCGTVTDLTAEARDCAEVMTYTCKGCQARQAFKIPAGPDARLKRLRAAGQPRFVPPEVLGD